MPRFPPPHFCDSYFLLIFSSPSKAVHKKKKIKLPSLTMHPLTIQNSLLYFFQYKYFDRPITIYAERGKDHDTHGTKRAMHLSKKPPLSRRSQRVFSEKLLEVVMIKLSRPPWQADAELCSPMANNYFHIFHQHFLKKHRLVIRADIIRSGFFTHYRFFMP